MPYVKRAKTYRRKFTKRRKPTLSSLSKKVAKLTENAKKYYDFQTDISADTTPVFYGLQDNITQGTTEHSRDGDSIYTKSIHYDYQFQANDPEGNRCRFMFILTKDGTQPTIPNLGAPTAKWCSSNGGRQYVLLDKWFSVGANQTQESSGTSSNSYYPWHRITGNIRIPNSMQHTQWSDGGGNPDNSLFVVFLSDSSLGQVIASGYIRINYWE